MQISDNFRKFIVFEGIDGSGKTTVVQLVSKKLSLIADTTLLREPTDSRFGNEIRLLLSESEAPPLEKITGLFISDRSIDVSENILPALNNGNIVLMDRYYFSNAAYQGAMGAVPEKILLQNKENGFPSPGLVFYMKIHPGTAISRIMKRRNEIDTQQECFEKTDFLVKVDSIYSEILPSNTQIINAEETPETCSEKVFSIIKEHLNL